MPSTTAIMVRFIFILLSLPAKHTLFSAYLLDPNGWLHGLD